MAWYSMVAIYLLFWAVSLFVVLPWGVQTAEEEGTAPVPGQADSAPQQLHMAKKLLATTVVAAVFFGIFLANWKFGWIDKDVIMGLMPGPTVQELLPQA